MDSFSACVPYPQSDVSDSDTLPWSFWDWTFESVLGELVTESGLDDLVSEGKADFLVASENETSSLLETGLAGADWFFFADNCLTSLGTVINLAEDGGFSLCDTTGLIDSGCFTKQPTPSMTLIDWRYIWCDLIILVMTICEGYSAPFLWIWSASSGALLVDDDILPLPLSEESEVGSEVSMGLESPLHCCGGDVLLSLSSELSDKVDSNQRFNNFCRVLMC